MYATLKPKRTFEEGKTAQDNFTRAMKTLFRTPKSAISKDHPKKQVKRKKHG